MTKGILRFNNQPQGKLGFIVIGLQQREKENRNPNAKKEGQVTEEERDRGKGEEGGGIICKCYLF